MLHGYVMYLLDLSEMWSIPHFEVMWCISAQHKENTQLAGNEFAGCLDPLHALYSTATPARVLGASPFSATLAG